MKRGVNLKYEFVPYREKTNDDELLSDLVECAHKIGADTISVRKYREVGKYGVDAITRRFGSWNKALVKANLQIGNRQFETEELFENLEKVWDIKGRQPSYNDMNNKNISAISSGTYCRRFGTWNKALKAFVDYMNMEDSTSTETESKYAKPDSRTINLRLRWKVLQRDSFKCCKCGASPATDSNVQLQVDHIIPWSKGGKTTIDNLQTLCSKCNLGKGNFI